MAVGSQSPSGFACSALILFAHKARYFQGDFADISVLCAHSGRRVVTGQVPSSGAESCFQQFLFPYIFKALPIPGPRGIFLCSQHLMKTKRKMALERCCSFLGEWLADGFNLCALNPPWSSFLHLKCSSLPLRN